MLVKAIRLRKKGEKLSRTVVGQSEPVLGNLNVELVPDPDQKRTVMAFLVQPGSAGTEVFPALDNVKLVAVRGDSFLITGIERFFDRKNVSVYRQGWWCRVVTSSAEPELVPA